MRENERVTIVFKGLDKARYDAVFGKMVEGEHKEVIYPCHVSDMGTELKSQLLDKATVEAKTLRFNRPIADGIDRIMIRGKPFVVINRKAFYNGQTVIQVSEVLSCG